jgi:hypothetical protein
MDRARQIREKLQQMARQFGPPSTLLGQVKSVDENELTCDLYDEETAVVFYDVRLRPVLDGKESLTLIPKVDTWALAARIEDDDEWMIIAAGEIDRYRLSIGQTVIEQDSTGLLIAKQDDTLKQVLTLIVEAVQKIVVIQGTNPDLPKLSQALTKINNLLR